MIDSTYWILKQFKVKNLDRLNKKILLLGWDVWVLVPVVHVKECNLCVPLLRAFKLEQQNIDSVWQHAFSFLSVVVCSPVWDCVCVCLRMHMVSPMVLSCCVRSMTSIRALLFKGQLPHCVLFTAAGSQHKRPGHGPFTIPHLHSLLPCRHLFLVSALPHEGCLEDVGADISLALKLM